MTEREKIIEQARKQKKSITAALKKHGFDKEPEVVIRLADMQTEDEESSEDGSALEFYSDKYVYNKELDNYVVFLKSAPRPMVISGADHRAIVSNYSNWTGQQLSVNEIARKFNIPRPYFEEYKKIFSLTHDREPLSVEQILSNDTDTNVSLVVEKKRHALHQKFLKVDWKQTQQDALKWNEFKTGKIDPYENFLSTWTPPPYNPVSKIFKSNSVIDKTLLIGISDTHIGAFVERESLFYGEDWNTAKAVEAIRQYGLKIVEDVRRYNFSFKKATICLLGDVMHGLRGMTEKGTPLRVDTMHEQQFEAAFNCMVEFIQIISQAFPYVSVKCVRGNHDSFAVSALALALKSYFRTDVTLDFEIYKSRVGLFKEHKTLVLIDHGADAYIKAKTPSAGKGREAYINSLLLSHPEELQDVNHKIYLVGDLHSYSQEEYNDFEYFRFGTSVKGDSYADAQNLKNKSRQNCLVIDDSGVKAVLHYYI